MALAVTINSVNLVAYLKDGTLRITTTSGGRAGRCDFTLNGSASVFEHVALTRTCVIADGATTYFDGTIRGYTIDEWNVGKWSMSVAAHDAGLAANEAVAPFSLSDVSPATTYSQMVALLPAYAWWRLGESSGTNAVDEESVQDGTYVNAPTLGVTGALANIADTAVTFNGTDEYVTVGSQHLGGQTDFTIAAWAKSSSANATQTIYCERHPTTGNAMIRLILTADGRPSFFYRDDAGTGTTVTQDTGDWTDGAWHHVVVTKSGTAIVIYVDGVSVHTGTLTGNNTLTGMSAYIGNDPRAVSQFFPGSLDEVMIFRYTLGIADVRQFYACRDVRSYRKFRPVYTHDGTTGTMTATVTTSETGLAPGQWLVISSANSSFPEDETQIREVSTAWLNATTPEYTVTVGDTPIKLAAAFP
jgi:hypothetical protein